MKQSEVRTFYIDFFNQLYAKRHKLETYEPRKVKDKLMEKDTLGFSTKSAKLKAAGTAGAQDRQRTRTGAGTVLDTQAGSSDQGRDDQVPGGDPSRFLPWLLLGPFLEDEALRVALFQRNERGDQKPPLSYPGLLGTSWHVGQDLNTHRKWQLPFWCHHLGKASLTSWRQDCWGSNPLPPGKGVGRCTSVPVPPTPPPECGVPVPLLRCSVVCCQPGWLGWSCLMPSPKHCSLTLTQCPHWESPDPSRSTPDLSAEHSGLCCGHHSGFIPAKTKWIKPKEKKLAIPSKC